MSVTTSPWRERGMPLVSALEVVRDLRGEGDIIVTSMGSAREWPKLSSHPLDLHYVPSTMGGVVPLGLGLALAQPQRQVIILAGDGSLLMNLGSLVSVVGSGAKNVSVVLLDNDCFEVTGGQKTAASREGANYAGFARAAGFPNVGQFYALADWQQRARGIFAQRGPRFVWLAVEPVEHDATLSPPGPMGAQLARVREALGTA